MREVAIGAALLIAIMVAGTVVTVFDVPAAVRITVLAAMAPVVIVGALLTLRDRR